MGDNRLRGSAPSEDWCAADFAAAVGPTDLSDPGVPPLIYKTARRLSTGKRGPYATEVAWILILARMGLPLTWLLQNETPLRRWFATRLPDIDAVPGGPAARLGPVVPRGRPDALPPWLMGAAFDWRLRIGLGLPEDVMATTAYAGWCLVADAPGDVGALHVALAAEEAPRGGPDPISALVAHARACGAGVDSPFERDEEGLAWVAVALARYEACYRSGVVRRDDRVRALGVHPTLDALASLCPDRAADELVRLVGAARKGLAPLFPATHIETNPDFTTLGVPADGDLIIDGLLLDLKTVTRPRLRAEWLWQVLGYVFLDGGRREIGRVGLYLSRHAWLQTWEVDDLLRSLAGMAVTEGELREEFEGVLAAMGP